MTTSATSSRFEPLDAVHRPAATLLVATDGTESADGALRVGLARAREMGAHLEVVAVAAPEPIMAAETSFALWSEANLIRRTALREKVEAQIARVSGQGRTHPVTLLDGNPAFTIARLAIEQRAAGVVVGLGRHRVVDRLFSDETALQLARISRVPVLAAPASMGGAPRHAVVAVDFSDLSPSAAQAAIDAVGDEGQVELVHVMPHVHEDAFTLEGNEPYARWTDEQLTALSQRLVVPPGVRLTTTAVRGRPAPELLAHASRVGADVIVTGTHGLGFVARTLLGSVTSQLLRAATCSVLTVPRDPLPPIKALPADDETQREHRERAWSEELASFTERNLGRRTILETDDLDMGAQGQEYNYPLIGAQYDPATHHVEIMLGDRRSQSQHLMRSIGGVAAIDVLTDGHGHDMALRVAHGSSQTLLSFVP